MPRRTRYARRSLRSKEVAAGNPPTQARRGSHCSGGCFAAETEGVLCVRSPKTAHTRRPARRIKRPSVPPAARGSAPAAAQKAAGRRKPCPQPERCRDAIAFRAALSVFVHARRSRFSSHPLRLSPLKRRAHWSRLRARPCRPHCSGAPRNGGCQAVLPAPGIRRNPGFTTRLTMLRPRVADYASPRRRQRGPGSGASTPSPVARDKRGLAVEPQGGSPWKDSTSPKTNHTQHRIKPNRSESHLFAPTPGKRRATMPHTATEGTGEGDCMAENRAPQDSAALSLRPADRPTLVPGTDLLRAKGTQSTPAFCPARLSREAALPPVALASPTTLEPPPRPSPPEPLKEKSFS